MWLTTRSRPDKFTTAVAHPDADQLEEFGRMCIQVAQQMRAAKADTADELADKIYREHGSAIEAIMHYAHLTGVDRATAYMAINAASQRANETTGA